eukprot:TRINITY_DN72978_c0_g1_i1.p1 TRINITY_DN72978_c0_g1~~TRINITY_DN72978_c0_g1_i1.p1  ORF type:complete len:339 (-),score=83.84 TRINITY_DN72978_c0_g1_i1:125-1141(-)
MVPASGAVEAPWTRWLLVMAVAELTSVGRGQTGIGSLNDPCDCMQHHDYWMATKTSLLAILQVPDFSRRIFDEQDQLHQWVKVQSCMYSPENEEAHRPTALSDCIPGFLFTHIVCMQRHVVERNIQRVLEYATELARLYPWGANCLRGSGWPFTAQAILGYVRRVRRVAAAIAAPGGGVRDDFLQELAWSATEGKDGMDPEAWEREVNFYGETDVCPAGSFPDAGSCWVQGAPGASCREACDAGGLEFRAPLQAPEEPVTPFLLALTGRHPRLKRQHAWAAFECYVSGEERFHPAAPEPSMGSGEWSYPICELACPCSPVLPSDWSSALQLVPAFETL